MIGPLLPPERGRWARPVGDNRLFLNGMLQPYARDALLQTLVDLDLTDKWQHMLDNTVVRAHSQATGAKGRGLIRRLLVGQVAALRAKSTPDVTIRDTLSALP